MEDKQVYSWMKGASPEAMKYYNQVSENGKKMFDLLYKSGRMKPMKPFQVEEDKPE